MSVNLAARQLREPGLFADIAKVLADTGWPPELLQLELTESDLMDTSDEPLATLRALAELGVHIAIDDFGTGSSTLAYLRHLPVHTLKLAGPFVTGTWDGADGSGDDVDIEIVGILVQLAHALGMSVVAESVETVGQRRQLRELGCDTAQGWLFAPSVPAGAVRDLVASPPW